MALYYNPGPSILSFTGPGGYDQTVIVPGSVVCESFSPLIRQLANDGLLKMFGSLKEFLDDHPSSRLAFVRTYSLGDVLMLWAVINFVRRKYPFLNITLLTHCDIVPVFESCSIHVTAYRGAPEGYDLIFMLDSVLEKDHEGGDLSHMHRVNIYLRALGWR